MFYAILFAIYFIIFNGIAAGSEREGKRAGKRAGPPLSPRPPSGDEVPLAGCGGPFFLPFFSFLVPPSFLPCLSSLLPNYLRFLRKSCPLIFGSSSCAKNSLVAPLRSARPCSRRNSPTPPPASFPRSPAQALKLSFNNSFIHTCPHLLSCALTHTLTP